MTKYKEIRGIHIQSVATDPEVYAGAWSSGGDLNQGRYSLSGGGTQTAGLAFGGVAAPSRRALTEEYDGSSWTENGDLNTARNELTGGGTQTAALAAGGYLSTQLNNVELYNGSSWTETTELNTAGDSLGTTAIGNVNTAILVLGRAPGNDGAVELWNGSSWTETTEVNTDRHLNASAGTTTSGITMGGTAPPGRQTVVESWNGSAWTEVGDLNAARTRMGASGTSNTSALGFAGESPPGGNVATTESFDGTSWTEVADLSTARNGLPGGGGTMSASQSLASGGYAGSPSGSNATEEWSFPSASVVQTGQVWFNTGSTTLKGYALQGTGSWSSGATYPASIYASAGFGTQDSAVVGSYAPGGGTEAASYDGTSWTVISDVNTSSTEKTGFGESNSNGYLVKGNTENWNGSSWTEVNDASNSFSLRTGFGSPSSAIVAAGESPPSGSNTVESWDGSSWTEVSELNTARYAAGGGGSGNTSGIIAGGTTGSNTANSETWDGSSWSEGNNLNTARHRVGSAGKSVSSSLIFGGESITGKTESYNGTSWTELADMATSRIDPAFGNTGTNVAALAVGGREPSASNKTEEFTSDNALSTITTS